MKIAGEFKDFAAVLFDLDGTLLDTIDDLADSMNAVLVRLGHPPHSRDAYRYKVGDGIVKLAERSLPETAHTEEAIARCVAEMREEYGRRWAERTRPYDGIVRLLAELAGAGLRLAVFSNKPDALTQATVRHFLPAVRFDVIQGEKAGIPRKPDPSGAVAIARALGIAPERFLYLGDTGIDMRCATSAGMFPAGALWGFRTRQELMENGARLLLPAPLDLLAHLAGEQP